MVSIVARGVAPSVSKDGPSEAAFKLPIAACVPTAPNSGNATNIGARNFLMVLPDVFLTRAHSLAANNLGVVEIADCDRHHVE